VKEKTTILRNILNWAQLGGACFSAEAYANQTLGLISPYLPHNRGGENPSAARQPIVVRNNTTPNRLRKSVKADGKGRGGRTISVEEHGRCHRRAAKKGNVSKTPKKRKENQGNEASTGSEEELLGEEEKRGVSS